MKKLSYVQKELEKSLEDCALKIYKAYKSYQLDFLPYIKISDAIDSTLEKIRGRHLFWKGYVNDVLEFEECMTCDILMEKVYLFESDFEVGEYGGFDLKIVQYDTENDEVVFEETSFYEVDNSPSITEGRG